MKLKINNEYVDVDFWSFTKCILLSYSLFIMILLIIGMLIGVAAA